MDSVPPKSEPFDGRAAPPSTCTVETTRYCNLRCRMCIQYLSGSTVRGPHLDLDAFQEIAAKVFPFVDVWQPSVSGEPLLTKGFPAMLETAAQYGVQLDLTTNGTVWNDALRDGVARALRSIQISFDSADPVLFEAIRRGARFAQVVAGIRALRQRCVELRGADMPRFGLSVTLMCDNADGLPDLVDYAALELGIDHMQVLHVFPTDAATRATSLVHDVERARRCIAEAAARATASGIELLVHPLDDVTAMAARETRPTRPVATGVGSLTGLEGVAVARPTAAEAAVPAVTGVPPRIGYCPFLWERTYVHIGGDVLPCCVPGAPVVGSIWNGDFDSTWNGPLYRELRQRVVARDPAPVCRGCRGYREIDDPVQIARVLRGSQPPSADAFGAGSPELDPMQAPTRRTRTDRAPRISWPEAVDPARAVLEFSTDRFVTIVFSTAWSRLAVDPDGWYVPQELWQLTPRNRTLFWRLMPQDVGSAAPLASGRLEPQLD